MRVSLRAEGLKLAWSLAFDPMLLLFREDAALRPDELLSNEEFDLIRRTEFSSTASMSVRLRSSLLSLMCLW